MKENSARIAIILDRSGSMASVRESTVAGFNEFIRSQRALPGDVPSEVTVKLVQFDDQYEVVFDMPLAEVPELTQDLFVPRGSTALTNSGSCPALPISSRISTMPRSIWMILSNAWA